VRRLLGAGAAGLALLAAYVGLSFLNSPRGFLGTDTGGKVATLRVMTERGRFDPDLGYWAERWDPNGALHPLANTTHTSSGRWVNVTTLPALWVGWELFRVGGYRAALLVPMAGSIAAAFAARSLLVRFGVVGRRAWAGFWLVGLASPLAIYALDFWEHSLGVAFMAWAVVLLLGLPATRSPAKSAAPALGAGVLFGAAATMRTEALVYLVVAVAVSLVLSRTDVRKAAAVGVLLLVGASVPLLANEAVERRVVGTTIRGARVAGTAAGVGAAPASRIEEAAVTTFALDGSSRGMALGAAFAALIAFAAVLSSRFVNAQAGMPASAFTKPDAGLAVVALAGAGALLAVRIATGGLGFVPGMLAAWPAATFAFGKRQSAIALWRFPNAVAIGAVPLVLATQFRGGAGPQWGGRYLLLSGFLLAVVGMAVVFRPSTPKPVALAMAALCAGVTTFGLAWVHERTHDVDRAIAAINRRPEPVIVSGIFHLAREGGATYRAPPDDGGKRWLTMTPTAGPAMVADVLRRAGMTTFADVVVRGAPRRQYPGYEPGATTHLRLFDGVDLEVTTWRTPS
jgi:hypothetical protein